jgi:hypothetical protein
MKSTKSTKTIKKYQNKHKKRKSNIRQRGSGATQSKKSSRNNAELFEEISKKLFNEQNISKINIDREYLDKNVRNLELALYTLIQDRKYSAGQNNKHEYIDFFNSILTIIVTKFQTLIKNQRDPKIMEAVIMVFKNIMFKYQLNLILQIADNEYLMVKGILPDKDNVEEYIKFLTKAYKDYKISLIGIIMNYGLYIIYLDPVDISNIARSHIQKNPSDKVIGSNNNINTSKYTIETSLNNEYINKQLDSLPNVNELKDL